MVDDPSPIREIVRNYYGSVLTSSADLQTNACCASSAPPRRVALALADIHPDVSSRFYGCGFPIPEAVEGKTVLDLGCGTGRDVFVLSKLVGPEGRVIGVDMTREQLDVARSTLSWHAERFGYSESNVTFEQGFIEDLSFIGDESIDIVVSNCVFNLSPLKDRVLREVYRVLVPGGEMYFSDVFCDRRLPADVSLDPLLRAECLGGAMYDFDFEVLAKRIGFYDPRTIARAPITIGSEALSVRVAAARFSSVTLRLLKLPSLEPRCEDYGQIATYRRPIEGVGAVFSLDDHHTFEIGRPERVCGNTAAMLQQTRFAPYFEVVGDTSTHYGVFDCGPTISAKQRSSPQTGCC